MSFALALVAALRLSCPDAGAAALMPARLGRTPARYERSLSELRRLGRRAGARLNLVLPRLAWPATKTYAVELLCAGEVNYTAATGRDGRLEKLVLPDLTELAVSEKDVRAYLGGRPAKELLAGLGLSGMVRGWPAAAVERFGRFLAVFDLATARGANPQELRADDYSLPQESGDQALVRALAWAKSLEYARGRTNEREHACSLPEAVDRLWRRAEEKAAPEEPWITARAMQEALAEGPALERPAASEVWRALACALERGGPDGRVPLAPEAAEALAAPSVELSTPAWAPWFEEIPAARSGLNGPAPEPTREPGEAESMMPGGLAVLDYDRDGRPDLLLCGLEQARLYRNLGDFRFEETTSTAGLAGVTCNGASSADYDNDGWPDLLALRGKDGRDHLLRNDHGKFVDVTAEVGLATGPAHSISAVWLDYDRDGKLDLYIVEGDDYRHGMAPVGDGRKAWPKRLYHNLGGRFEEVAALAGVADTGWGLAAAAFDADGDGWPDLYLVNDFGRAKLFLNRHDGTFREAAAQAGVDGLGNGMGVSVADFDHDGRPDLFVTYIGPQRPVARLKGTYRLAAEDFYSARSLRYRQRDRLYRNLGGGRFEEVYASSVEAVATGWGWNGFFLDAGNRGEQDLFQVNGWWPYQLAYGKEAKVFWRYDAAQKKFIDASAQTGAAFIGNSRASGYADFDGDGCLDLIVTGFHAPKLFAGRCERSRHWLGLRLEGTRSNRDGIGAVVTVKAGGLAQTAELGPQGGGFQNSLLRELHFGLGEHARADVVEVRWPSGARQTLADVSVDRVMTIKEDKQ